MVYSRKRIKNSKEKPAALRNAQKPHAACAAFCASSLVELCAIPSILELENPIYASHALFENFEETEFTKVDSDPMEFFELR
jgi:hypothetical protein